LQRSSLAQTIIRLAAPRLKTKSPAAPTSKIASDQIANLRSNRNTGGGDSNRPNVAVANTASRNCANPSDGNHRRENECIKAESQQNPTQQCEYGRNRDRGQTSLPNDVQHGVRSKVTAV